MAWIHDLWASFGPNRKEAATFRQSSKYSSKSHVFTAVSNQMIPINLNWLRFVCFSIEISKENACIQCHFVFVIFTGWFFFKVRRSLLSVSCVNFTSVLRNSVLQDCLGHFPTFTDISRRAGQFRTTSIYTTHSPSSQCSLRCSAPSSICGGLAGNSSRASPTQELIILLPHCELLLVCHRYRCP